MRVEHVLTAEDAAISYVAEVIVRREPGRREALEVNPDPWVFVHRWNDELGREQEEVLAVFDEAIALLDADRAALARGAAL